MQISLKIVAVLLVCAVLMSDARPPPGGQGKGKQQGPPNVSGKGGEQNPKPTQKPKPTNGSGDARPPRRPEALKGAGKFCGALVNGNITNDNATFNSVFTTVTGVCTDLLAWIKANKPTDAPTAEATRKLGQAGGKKPLGVEESSDSDDADRRHGNKTAVEILLRVCERVEKIPVNSTTIPDGLKSIIIRFDAVCEEAKKLAGGAAPTDAPVSTAAPVQPEAPVQEPLVQ